MGRRSEAGPLHPSQHKAFNQWYGLRRCEKNNIIKLHVGEGKTLIGLLVLQSKINSANKPWLFVSPNNYLPYHDLKFGNYGKPIMAWIIDFRGDVSNTSELSMDGSDSMRVIALLQGDELPVALTNLLSYLKRNEVTPTIVTFCEAYKPDFTPDKLVVEIDAIRSAFERLSSDRPVALAFGISSEAEKNY